jgi:serine O-acetyltransferase
MQGYHALQSYRAAHWLWHNHSRVLALALQARISEVFAVDIHPAAQIGKAILLDHGTGVVIGETAVIGDRVSMLQVVALRYIYLFQSSSLPAFHCMNTH